MFKIRRTPESRPQTIVDDQTEEERIARMVGAIAHAEGEEVGLIASPDAGLTYSNDHELAMRRTGSTLRSVLAEEGIPLPPDASLI